MDRKKIVLTSLASVAVLGAALAASQPSVVKADVSTNTTTTSAQPAGTPDTSVTNSNEQLTLLEILRQQNNQQMLELLTLLNQKLQVQKLKKLKMKLKKLKKKLLKLKLK